MSERGKRRTAASAPELANEHQGMRCFAAYASQLLLFTEGDDPRNACVQCQSP